MEFVDDALAEPPTGGEYHVVLIAKVRRVAYDVIRIYE